MELYSINNLRVMEVIDINTGSKLGYISDLIIDCNDYRILSITIPLERTNWFGKNNVLEIEWDKIQKIGREVILVKVDNIALDNK